MKEINLITIGLQIRRIRKDKNLSLQEIANRTGLSKSLLSKVENFRTIPSLPVLLRISDVLNVDMAELVKGINKKHKQAYTIVRKNERKIIERENARGFTYESLIITENKKTSLFESFILTLKKDSKRKLVSTDGNEFLFILKGKIEFEYGKEKILLRKGDSIFFDGRIPHVPRNIEQGEVKILVIYLLN
ncbi:helix-turn-helix transcriptional regulator [bacterium]|nr:helix-turn-helix transcriptional regulator [bacterium]